jgi:hypothetical protein
MSHGQYVGVIEAREKRQGTRNDLTNQNQEETNSDAGPDSSITDTEIERNTTGNKPANSEYNLKNFHERLPEIWIESIKNGDSKAAGS